MLVWGAGARTRVRSWWGDIGMAHVPTAELVGGVGADAEGLGQAPPHSSVHGGRGTTRHPGGVGGLGDTEPGALKAVFVGGGSERGDMPHGACDQGRGGGLRGRSAAMWGFARQGSDLRLQTPPPLVTGATRAHHETSLQASYMWKSSAGLPGDSGSPGRRGSSPHEP